ncbi:MAG: acyl-CoA/acyl-ACP dehydrogenase [Actinomycetota bacterium]|nr:acyl-CoA/acyl-ACP dehydrogenase [Actinomycetota bacterium]
MEQCLTARQREIVDLAGRLADEFAERAREHDREGSFPFENYERMREEGYLGLTVPEELGGMGAGLQDLILAQERLAAGDGSTALAVSMHVSPIGQLASLWRVSGDERLADVLRRAADGRLVYASMSAEPGDPILMSSTTTARPVEGGYRVTGKKIFGTESAVCTEFSTRALLDDPEDGPTVIFFRLQRDVEGMTVKDTWDVMGMRATQSNDFDLDDVFVAEEDVIHRYPAHHFDGTMLKTVWGWAMPTFGAVYLGIGAGAMAFAREFALRTKKADLPEVQHLFAEMEVLLETARAVLHRHAQEMATGALYSDLPVQEGMARAVLAKYVATNNACGIVDRALHVVGGAGYFRRFPLERMYRDVRAGPIMPYTNLEAHDLFGRTALGIEIAPAVPLPDEHRPRTSVDGSSVR